MVEACLKYHSIDLEELNLTMKSLIQYIRFPSPNLDRGIHEYERVFTVT